MDELIIIGALAAIVLPLTAGLLAWHVHFEPKWNGERWVKAAAALGLTLERRSGYIANHMVGAFGGVRVRVGIRTEVESGGVLDPRDRRVVHYTCVEAALARPLDAGLRLSPSGWLASAVGELVGLPDLQVGHAALDSSYTIVASDPEQARRLLTTPYVLEPLLALSSAAFRPYLSDSVVKLEARRKCLNADVPYCVIENAVELAGRLAAAREALGPSHLERVIGEVWGAVAAARGLTLDVERRVMSGRTEGVHVEVHAVQRETQPRRGSSCASIARSESASGSSGRTPSRASPSSSACRTSGSATRPSTRASS